METKDFLLEKVTSSGKWVEFWDAEDIDRDHWSHSSKWGYFDKAIEDAGLSWYVESKGYKGIIITFELISPNWEVKSVRLSNKIQLSFEELYRTMEFKDRPNRAWDYPYPEMSFTSKVALEFAKRYHEQQLRHMKNIDVYL